ncbi:hypothetical protein [Bradyrhizobium sp. USDA 4502]
MFVVYLHLPRTVIAAGMLLLSASLCGCATFTDSSLMDARAEMTAEPGSYLPVEDLPKPRKHPAMTADQQSKLLNELSAARERQSAAAKAQGRPITEPVKPWTATIPDH